MTTLTRVEVAERMTAQDFLRYAPEDQKAELIDGVMIVHSPPLDPHERLFVFLIRLLGDFVEQSGLGEVRGSRTPVILEEEQAYEPDILFVAQDRVRIIEEAGVFGAPDMVIEILPASTASHDRGTKFRAYERAGVRELWLLDPYGPAGTEFYQQHGKRLAPVMPDAQGIVRSVAVPGFWIRVEWLWPREKFISVSEALKQIAAGSARPE